jgi:PAS domain S-box-containing protein
MGINGNQALKMLDSLVNGVLVQTVPTGRLVHVNRNFLELLGCELTGFNHHPDSWIDHIHGDDQDVMRQWWKRLLAHPTPAEQTYRVLPPGQSLRWVQCRTMLLDAAQGDQPCLATIHIDVTGQCQGLNSGILQCEALQRVLGAFAIGIGYCGADGHLAWVNAAFESLLDYGPGTLLGRSLQTLIAPNSQSTLTPDWPGLTRKPWSQEVQLLTRYNQGRWMLVTVAPLEPRLPESSAAVCIIQDITHYKQAEDQLRTSLRSTEVLMAEIHHRVKNNLQIISSLLELQANRTQDSHTRAILLSSQDRVLAMSLIHETLYQSDDMAQINFAAYVQQLVGGLSRAYRGNQTIDFQLKLEGTTTISTNLAVPLGLMLNELVTNALKHNLSSSPKGTLVVTLRGLSHHRFEVAVQQTAGKLPDGFSLDHPSSMGLQIVKLLALKIGADLKVQHQPTTFTIVFSTQA